MKHLKLYEDFAENKIEDFVRQESYLELDDSDSDSISFITRENGNVMDGTPGAKDIEEAKRMKELIQKKFGLGSEIEDVDEWVYLKVILNKKPEVISYAIIKHDGPLSTPGWRGFSESCKTPEELVKKITRWTDINTKKAKELVEQLDKLEYNGNNFLDNFVDLKIPSKAMGYDWTIRKSIKKK